MKRILTMCFFAIVATWASAESRAPGAFYTPEKLAEMSTLVFEGTVAEIETNVEYKVSFPTKALVSKVVKGKLEAKELTFKHKHPGKHVIIEKEYNTPSAGQVGTFYLQDQGDTLILIGYIKKTEPPAGGDGKPAPQP